MLCHIVYHVQMDREEIKYQLQLGEWIEDKHGNFHRLLGDRPTRVKFHKTGLITVEHRSRFKQWVIVGEAYDRYVRRHGKFLIIDDVELKVRK